MKARFSALLPAVFVSALAFAGCGEITKVQECNKVIETVNASDMGTVKGDDKKAWEEESKKALELEKKLSEVKITDEGLKKHVEEYREMLKQYAELAKKTGSVGDGDLQGALDLMKKATDLMSKSSELTTKINNYCSGQSK